MKKENEIDMIYDVNIDELINDNEQTEQNGEDEKDFVEDSDENTEFDQMISDIENCSTNEEEINSSILNAVNDNTLTVKVAKKKEKKSLSQIADEVVNRFLADKSDKNWQDLQEFFWFGIKQWAYKFMKSADDAEDMTIETFANAYEKIDMYDASKGRFSTWLFTCCKNICLGNIKKKKKLNIIDNDISDIYESELSKSGSYVNTSSFDSIDYNVFKDGTIKKMDISDLITKMYNVSIKEMRNFNDVVAEIMELKYLKGMKIREIADLKGMNQSTIKNHLYRGQKNLANIIKINHKDLYDSYIDAMYNEDVQ